MVFIVANWKMNKSQAQAVEYIHILNKFSDLKKHINVLISPPSIHLPVISSISDFPLVAQNVSHLENGALTGEISAQMLSKYVKHVIVGHSERRQFFLENNFFIKEKIQMCFKYKLSPIFCFGENKNARNKGNYLDFIKSQIQEVLFDFDVAKISSLILAYEPIWAIGTGNTATALQIEEVHTYVRNLLILKFGESIGFRIPILYGGSCNSDNAVEILSNDHVDGLLVGGASLDASNFINIIKIANEFSSNRF
ncbi:MAG: triose-phosphate isomerase [Flavobacteriales bacterium TMED191]|nr:MAG: triose-phosphate isomerase [Flavobacteriales bacterium TMED191]